MVGTHLRDVADYAHIGTNNSEQWISILNTLRIRSATLTFQATRRIGLLSSNRDDRHHRRHQGPVAACSAHRRDFRYDCRHRSGAFIKSVRTSVPTIAF